MSSIKYEVKSGENLSTIARRHKMTEATLSRFNGISEFSELVAGQSLLIPKQAESSQRSQTKAPTIYQVRAGEGLPEVAQRFQVTEAALREANGLGASGVAMIGMKLTIPQPQALKSQNPNANGFRVKSLKLSATGVAAVPGQSPVRLDVFHFAPGREKVHIAYEVEDASGQVKSGRLSLFSHSSQEPLRTWELELNELSPGAHTVTWDGTVTSDPRFPDDHVTLEHSPYEVRLLLQGATPSESSTAATPLKVGSSVAEVGARRWTEGLR